MVSRGWLDFLPRTTASASDHHDLLLEQTNSKTRARFVETAFAAFLSQKKYYRPGLRRAGIVGANWYTLRHTAASRRIMAGGDVVSV